MTLEERNQLRETASVALREVSSRALESPSSRPYDQRWRLQTSNSFRRIGTRGDGDVLCATSHRADGHPDLMALPGVLDYIVAAQPLVVLDLLDRLVALEVDRDRLSQLLVTACDELDDTGGEYAQHVAEDLRREAKREVPR